MMDKVLHFQRQMNNVILVILLKQDKVLQELGYVGHNSTDFEHGVKCSTLILDGGKSSTEIVVVALGYTQVHGHSSMKLHDAV